MIVLDTNVVSEPMRPEPHAAMMRWLNAQPTETLYLSSVTLAELLFGLAALPDGGRKDRLQGALDGLLAIFGDRVLPFDRDAARRYAPMAAEARRRGRALPVNDGYIAATAAARGFAVATRNVADFAQAGVDVIDPFQGLPAHSPRVAGEEAR